MVFYLSDEKDLTKKMLRLSFCVSFIRDEFSAAELPAEEHYERVMEAFTREIFEPGIHYWLPFAAHVYLSRWVPDGDHLRSRMIYIYVQGVLMSLHSDINLTLIYYFFFFHFIFCSIYLLLKNWTFILWNGKKLMIP